MSGLIFKKLTLTDFRNYSFAEFNLDGRSVVLTGPNGAGKTNVLEALSMLSPGRGLRGARLDELTRRTGEEGSAAKRHWAVSGLVRQGNDEVRIGTGLDLIIREQNGSFALMDFRHLAPVRLPSIFQ